jgi:hypothetical protein
MEMFYAGNGNSKWANMIQAIHLGMMKAGIATSI